MPLFIPADAGNTVLVDSGRSSDLAHKALDECLFCLTAAQGRGRTPVRPLPCFYVYGLVLQPSELLLGRRIQKRGLFWGNRVPDVAVLNEEK